MEQLPPTPQDNKPIKTAAVPRVMPWLTPLQTLKTIKATTLEEAFVCPSAPIVTIYRVSKSAATAILSHLMNDVIDFLNVGMSMEGKQLLQTVELVLNDTLTKNLKPEDFKVCFENAKKGIYGENYNRIDGQVIFKWLYRYCNDKADYAENISIKEHAEFEKKRLEQAANPEGQKRVADILKSANMGAMENEKLKDTVKHIPNERALYIQKCLTDFDKQHKIEGLNVPGRYIMYMGQPVDQVEFTEIKLKEAAL